MWFHLWHLRCIINCSYSVVKPLLREAPGPMSISVKQAAALRRGGGKGALHKTPVSKTRSPIPWNRLRSPAHKLGDPQGSMQIKVISGSLRLAVQTEQRPVLSLTVIE